MSVEYKDTKSEQSLTQKIKNLNRVQKIVLWSAAALILYTILGFLVLPPILKIVLEKKLPEALHRPFSIQKIQINPYTLTATLEGLAIQKQDGSENFIGFDRLFVNLQIVSIFKRALIIKSVALSGPRVNFTRNQDQTYNFSDLIAEKSIDTPQQKPEKPFLFSIHNIEINGGAIKFQDLPKDKIHRIAELDMAIPDISNLSYDIETYVMPAFSAAVNNTKISMGGMTKPFADTQEVIMDINFNGLNIPEYLAYVPNPTRLTLQSGIVDINARLSYLNRRDNTSKLAVTGLISIYDIDVTDDQGASYIRLPHIAITMADSNLLEKEIRIANLTLKNPELRLERLSNNDILPISLMMTTPETNQASPEEKINDNGGIPFEMTIDEILLENGNVMLTMRDMGPATSAVTKIDNFNMTFSDLSTAQNSKGGLSFGFRLNEEGEISGKGGLGLVPLSASLALDIKNLGLKPLQPYIAELVNIVITSGAVSVNGNLELNQQDQEGVVIQFGGDSRLSDLAIVDAFAGEDLLGLKNLSITGVRFSSQPQSLAIKDISLQDIFAKLIVAKDGTLNLATLKRSEAKVEQKPEAETSGEKSDRRIEIGSISVKGGRVDFQDRKITPVYSAVLDELEGKITGISTEKETIAEVELAGKLNKHSPLNVSGKIAPLKDELFVDLKIDCHDIDLSPTSPYTGKYIAYKTDKGKLTLNLHYIINGKVLDAENHAFLDQFTLGDSVESPDAASLPVSLAISLLKNRKGEIHLNVPVQGDLDDPEFSVGGVIVKVIFGLIAKAATSPFALLTALIPDGEDLQHVTFEPGLSDISRDASGKLEKMAGVLYERPGLRVDIIGRVEPARDRDALIKMRFDKLINLQKLHELRIAGTKETPQIETIEITTEKYPRYLSRAYEAVLQAEIESKGKDYETTGMLRQFPILKKFSLNRSVFGRLVSKMSSKDKPLTPEEHSQLDEMEKLLKAWIKVSDEELRLLAIQRAENVLGFLLEKGPVEAERLFIIEPQQVEPVEDADEKMTGMQVEMVIK